ncbi:MAG TPA: 2-oxo acid dehydrogenase subunit E2 [Planctomycetota bacterium]|nr:2-oxo acid dehydrogenase subunit E2 [Planctomycetota bacterium]
MRSPGRAVSPRARRALARSGVDPASITGSGPNGRVVEADVLRAPSASALSPGRRAVARRTAESFRTIPHFYLRAEVDAEALIALRRDLVASLEPTLGFKPTLTDLLLRAMALALADQPHADRVWRGESIATIGTGAVGLVVGLDDGVAIPMIAAEGIAGTARQRAAAVAAARAGRAAPGACATSLSNLGAGRVDDFAAIVPLGQSSVLAVGRAARRPFVDAGGALVARTTLRLCLSVDHRVLDGQPAADFLGRIVALIERPEPLVS